MEAVVVKGLTYQYHADGPLVLKGMDFQVEQGEIVVVTGLSGSGKSTLCLCISGIIRQQRDGIMGGEIVINGKNIREMRGGNLAFEIGMVFQDPDTQLFSPTVEDEIAFAPENMCLPPDRILERVNNVIDLLGITDLRYANPCQLSGGEKQLVALAAVLALDPPVLILDEIMSQLDTEGRTKVAVALEKIRDRGKTLIIVEHNLETLAFADRLMVVEAGQIIRFDRAETILADRDFLSARRMI